MCEGEWTEPDDFLLRCDEWLQDNYFYMNLDVIVDKFLHQAFRHVASFFGRLEPFLQGYWENKRLVLDFDRGLQAHVASELLRHPLEVIPFLLQRFKDQRVAAETTIPDTRNLGLLQMNLLPVKTQLAPQAKACFNKLRKTMVSLFYS